MERFLSLCLQLLYAAYIGLVVTHSVLQRRFARGEPSTARRAHATGHWRPAVDVVVACYNEDPFDLEACCLSLLEQDYEGELRVWLIDDGSSNRGRLLEVYRRYQDRPGWQVLLLDRHAGKRQAQDAAVRRGTGELVITVDSDTNVAPDGIRRLVRAFAYERVGVVSGDVAVSNASTNRLTGLIDRRYRLRFEQERAAQGSFGAVLCCAGPFSAYRRRALAPCWRRYLGQRFLGRPCTSGDDLHLTNLVLAAGWQALHEGRARAYTTVPATLSKYVRQQLRWNRSLYRELAWTLPALRRRHPYLALDVAARALLPLMVLAAVALLAAETALTGAPLGWDAQIVVAMLLVHAFSIGWQVRDARFVLMYGLLYLLILAPLRIWALLALPRDRWRTRDLSGSDDTAGDLDDHAPVG